MFLKKLLCALLCALMIAGIPVSLAEQPATDADKDARIAELEAQVAELEAQGAEYKARADRAEFRYRCEVLINQELQDLCRAHGVDFRPALKDRPW